MRSTLTTTEQTLTSTANSRTMTTPTKTTTTELPVHSCDPRIESAEDSMVLEQTVPSSLPVSSAEEFIFNHL
ncbi:hypothetical protein Y032_0044g1029 [Ancylostoma ceylanicum]|uniref:Uncharacterized protein n=1 Tax=Ancylostoma ceylanicum TaxID=53326 RepID=A0A016UEB5_9BILA|nr:hypothetical protein Y032_0044g1029 [Ancylostoma ceylanicum]